ncbi:MAG: nucleotide sugar dehydrogenase [Candidatus Moranbacteria bacterium]|nr:nucleotide sugar dehydrogenase [Candidatus Moranbacteria bacterium]
MQKQKACPPQVAKQVGREKVCVLGLGYVGFPLAIQCAAKGYAVFGYDKDEKKLACIEKGENIVDEKYLEALLPKTKINIIRDEKEMGQCDIFIIAVPTPVDEKYYPDLGFVEAASRTVAENMKSGALVVVESTINPGVCEEVVRPIFEKAGWKVGETVFISHCPERINPGDPKWNVTNIPRVVGSFDEEGLEKSVKFYESILDGQVMPMKTIREAEAAKIIENSFRDVNIAFVNELAKSFDLMGIDIVNVIKGASTKPFAFMPHWPSRGVGGHCIPVDPYYLIEKAKENDFDHKFLRSARAINNSMPAYTVEVLQEMLNQIEKSIKGTHIGVLGVSYKANVGDLRESPALKVIEILEKHGAKLHIFDPYLPEHSNMKNIEEMLEKSESVVLLTDHSDFLKIKPEQYKEKNIQVILDGMNCLDKEAFLKAGLIFKGIGR